MNLISNANISLSAFLIVQAYHPQATCSCTASRGNARGETGTANPKGRVQGAPKRAEKWGAKRIFEMQKKKKICAQRVLNYSAK